MKATFGAFRSIPTALSKRSHSVLPGTGGGGSGFIYLTYLTSCALLALLSNGAGLWYAGCLIILLLGVYARYAIAPTRGKPPHNQVQKGGGVYLVR
jgi:hypothetical protein